MDKCAKNMTLVALNIFGLITILDFFQDTFVSIFKTKRPSDYFAFFSFLLCGGQAYFYIFVFGLLGSTTGRGPHFFNFLIFFLLSTTQDQLKISEQDVTGTKSYVNQRLE